MSLRLNSALLIALAPAAVGCAAPPADENVDSSEHAEVSDIASMTARGDGTFDVTCRDGRHEIVSADDVRSDRVCRAPAFPASPFDAGACTGTPMTEADARARLGSATGAVTLGTFRLALRHRTPHYAWSARGWSLESYTWDDAPTDALVAWRETGMSSTTGAFAAFPRTGRVELAADAAGAPYLRLVGDAANVTGPDTTRFMRVVSNPLRPWASTSGPTFALEESHGDGSASATWSAVSEWGWSLELRERSVGDYARHWWFKGAGVTSIVTTACAQFISVQSMSQLSAIDAAIGVSVVLE